MSRDLEVSTTSASAEVAESAPVDQDAAATTRFTANGPVPPVAGGDSHHAASSASDRAYDADEPAQFVERITSQAHGATALAQALRSSGRDNDPAVLVELHRKLGDKAFAVVEATTAKLSGHTSVETSKKGASVHHAKPTTTSHDGSVAHASSSSIGVEDDTATATKAHSSSTIDGDVTKTTSKAHSFGKGEKGWTLGSTKGHQIEHGAESTSNSATAGLAYGEHGASASAGAGHSHTTTNSDKSTDTTSASGSLSVDKDGASGKLSASSGHQDDKWKDASGHEHAGASHSSSATMGGTLGKDKQALSLGGNTQRTSKNGNGFSLGFNAEASRTKHQETHKGLTTLEIETRAAVTASASVNTKHVGAKASHTEGKSSSFTAIVPEAAAKGLDLTTLDPSHPELLPEKASIQLDSSKFKGTMMGGNIEALSMSSETTKKHGTSLLIQKIDGNHVRVTSGPTEAISRVTSLGLDLGLAGVALTGSVDVGGATLHSAEYDLRNPEAQTAYEAFLQGTVPTSKTAGADNVKTIEKLDAHASSGMSAHLGPAHISAKGRSSELQATETTSADGSKDLTQQTTIDGRMLEHQQHLDAAGTSSGESYTIVLKNKNSVESLLKAIPNAKLAPNAKEFRYELNPTSLAALYEQAKRAGAALRASAKRETGNEHFKDSQQLMMLLDMSKTPESFLHNLHRLSVNEFVEAELLFQISDLTAGTDTDNKFAPLPGSIS